MITASPSLGESQMKQWHAQLTEKEKALHALAAVKLKKELKVPNDQDNGSYFPERSHAFQAWLKNKRN